MRALLQRVSEASVHVDGEQVGVCAKGLLIFLGIAPDDDKTTAQRLWNKILHLRIFNDENAKMNYSLADVSGEVLIVSQFTLFADSRHGHRPSFVGAAGADQGRALYDYFCELAEYDVTHVGQGIFGADMQVCLTNDGPVTIWLDTDALTGGQKR